MQLFVNLKNKWNSIEKLTEQVNVFIWSIRKCKQVLFCSKIMQRNQVNQSEQCYFTEKKAKKR